MNEKFEMHCIVEIFGHTKIAGKVSEQTVAGQGFIRVDVPKTSKRDGFTRLYGTGAIYAMTPVSEEIAALMAERLEVEAVSEWTLSQAVRDLLPARVNTRAGEEWDSSYKPPDDRFFDDDDPDPDDVPDRDTSDDGDLAHPATSPQDEAVPEPASVVDSWPDDGPDYAKDKRAAAQWARELLKGEFVIVDTETTGFEADDEIIQIGSVDQTGATVLDQLIKPTKPVPNSNYHGLTDDMLATAPGFPEVHERIKLALQGKVVLAYNTEYDSRMLSQVCRKHGLEGIVPSATHCVMEQYAQFNGEWNDYHGNYRWKKLRDALAAFGLKHEDFGTKEHDACTDARATLAVIRKMAEFDAAPTAAV